MQSRRRVLACVSHNNSNNNNNNNNASYNFPDVIVTNRLSLTLCAHKYALMHSYTHTQQNYSTRTQLFEYWRILS